MFVESATSSPPSPPQQREPLQPQQASMTHPPAAGGSQQRQHPSPPQRQHSSPQPVKMEYYTSVMRNTVKGENTIIMMQNARLIICVNNTELTQKYNFV